MNSRPLPSKCPRSPLDSRPVDVLLVAAAGVAVEPGLVADEDPADLVDPERVAVGVEDAHDAARRRPAGRGRGGLEVVRAGDRGQGDLGRAVDVVEDRARTGAAPPSPAWRRGPTRSRRCSAATRCRSGRCTSAAEGEDPLQHHGHDDEPVGPVLGDRRQRGLRVELRLQHGGRRHAEPDAHVHEAPGVEQRRGDDHGVTGPDRHPRQQRRQPVAPAGTGPGGALRTPGRARREDDHPPRAPRRRQRINDRSAAMAANSSAGRGDAAPAATAIDARRTRRRGARRRCPRCRRRRPAAGRRTRC